MTLGENTMRDKKSRFFKPIWYKLTGRSALQKHIKTININEVKAAYDTIIRFKQAYIQCYKQAIGKIIPSIEQNKNLIKQLNEEIEEYNQHITNTIANMKKFEEAEKITGASDEEIKQNLKYKEWVDRKDSMQTMIEERNNWIVKRKQDIERFQKDIEAHKQQLTNLINGIELIKTDQSEAIEHINYIRKI